MREDLRIRGRDEQTMKRAGRARVLSVYVRGLGLEERNEQVPWMTTRTREKKGPSHREEK